jgi:hypothetical protein
MGPQDSVLAPLGLVLGYCPWAPPGRKAADAQIAATFRCADDLK